MIDLKFIRSNPDEVRAAIRNKNEKADLDALLELDETRRGLQFEFDQFKSRQNQVSQTIAKLKREGGDASALLEEMGSVAEQIKAVNGRLTEINAELEARLLTIPNLPEASVPVGRDESSNILVKTWGEQPSFAFTPSTIWSWRKRTPCWICPAAPRYPAPDSPSIPALARAWNAP